MEIAIDFPILGDPDRNLEIGEISIEHGIFEVQTKSIELNNKHFIVELWYICNHTIF
jgi:hypothetical protein